jgi:hypothetical protein
MPDLRVRMKKRADGGAVLQCDRPDGSTTWQRQDGKLALFFPYHDLTHLAVETVLGFRRGFYGLIAEGWDIVDTTGKGARGPLPEEAILVEHLVGLFDSERLGGSGLPAEEFNEQMAQICGSRGMAPPREFGDEELKVVRARRDMLHDRWRALQRDRALDLSFTRA